MKAKTIYVDEVLWEKAMSKADKEGQKLSRVISLFLEKYLKG